MHMNRRSLFKFLAGVAALPVVAKLPDPVRWRIKRVGAWCTCQITEGVVTSVRIIDTGSGYTSSPVDYKPPKTGSGYISSW